MYQIWHVTPLFKAPPLDFVHNPSIGSEPGNTFAVVPLAGTAILPKTVSQPPLFIVAHAAFPGGAMVDYVYGTEKVITSPSSGASPS